MSLTLTNEAIEVLNKHASVRKRGDFISDLLTAYEYDENAIASVDVESIKIQMVGISSMLKTLEAKQLETDRKLAKRMADSK